MASAGRILIMPKGDYDANSTYENLDLVKHKGTSWLAKKTAKGIEPSEANAEYWQDVFEPNIANNLTTTTEGYALDARQGKVLHDLFAFENWKSATLLEGWTGEFVYSKNGFGQVRLRLELGTGTNIASGTVIAKIPEEYAPKNALPIPILKSNLSPYDSVLGMLITVSGDVIIRSPLTDELTASYAEASLCSEITYWLE